MSALPASPSVPTEFVSVPVAVLEAITRRDNSIATAVEVRGWAYELLAVHNGTTTANSVGTKAQAEVNQTNQVIP